MDSTNKKEILNYLETQYAFKNNLLEKMTLLIDNGN